MKLSKYLLIKVWKMNAVRDIWITIFIGNPGYVLQVGRTHTCLFLFDEIRKKLHYGQSMYHKMVRIHKVLLKSSGNGIAKYLAGSFSKHAERCTPEGFLSPIEGSSWLISHHNYLCCGYIDSSLTTVLCLYNVFFLLAEKRLKQDLKSLHLFALELSKDFQRQSKTYLYQVLTAVQEIQLQNEAMQSKATFQTSNINNVIVKCW